MGSLFRSELMSLCQLYIQSEAVYNCVSQLGELGCVQFKDLNANVIAFQRKFVNEVRRCNEMERTLSFIEEEIIKENIVIMENVDNHYAPQPREMIGLETRFAKIENELIEVSNSIEPLRKTYFEINEFKCVLSTVQQFFSELDGRHGQQLPEVTSETQELIIVDTQSITNLNFVAGIIRRDRLPAFELMLWRICCGNVFLRQTPIEHDIDDRISDNNELRSVFLIFYRGDQLKLKIKKVCEGFRAKQYPCPEESSERQQMIRKFKSRINDINIVIKQTREQRERILFESAKSIKSWMIKVRKMKSIYHTMNLFNFDVTQNGLIAECWCADQDICEIRQALSLASEQSGSAMPCIVNIVLTNEKPPTYNRTNKVTEGFQSIIDSYGVPDYREVNPSAFTIITFPFLFALMFGDAGHGIIMFLFALWMVLKENTLQTIKTNNDIWLTFFHGRYIILLMGCFSIYTGLIYNDMFSKALNVFGTAWNIPEYNESIKDLKEYAMNPQFNLTGSPYQFGFDPIWQISSNKIAFLNSFKKKLSVIIGVSHMLFGIGLSFWNHTYFRKPLSIYCEFMPQLIFLVTLFGYMNCLIFAKWFVFSAKQSGSAPSILINIINMFLLKYPDQTNQTKSLNTWYFGQKQFQIFLLVLALLCIPWMLAIKPLILRKQHRKHYASITDSTSVIMVDDNTILIDTLPTHSTNHSFDFGDVIIHQTIHTIEFCLGCISHTASYLRLWALSLAHAQLSEVLWSLVMRHGIKCYTTSMFVNGVVMFIVFAFWAFLTISILLVMEALSAFLHALRLHWVEFQSKFYTGSGYRFEPFSFRKLLESYKKVGEN